MDPIVAGALGSLITTIGGAVVIWFTKIRKVLREDRREDAKEQRESYGAILAEHEKLLEGNREELDEMKKELKVERAANRRTRDELARTQADLARAQERIVGYEDILRSRKIEVRPYNPLAGPGSGSHPALPPQPAETDEEGV